ncbi:hypothetical protein SEVIR_9G168500v4 [Setaria viridis]|uniref:Secreted protein n=1 Tax=Setaria viridis TaxID=4556 RepID=A0A4U6SWQ0_SETVI|nr:hypothetical protein SEVIR_9G168500v2 [Setaria viridis]
MKFVASSRTTASTTVLLALVVTGWCMAMAAAVPVADARRLQDIPVSTEEGGDRRLQSQLSSLVAIVESVLRKYGVTKTVADLLDLDIQQPRAVPGDLQITGQGQPRTRRDLQSPLNQVVSELETVAKSIAGSPLEELPIDVVCRIIGLTNQMQSVVGALQDLPVIDGQGQLRTRVPALRSLLNDVQRQLQTRASRLRNPSSNGHDVSGIRGSACAQQKP